MSFASSLGKGIGTDNEPRATIAVFSDAFRGIILFSSSSTDVPLDTGADNGGTSSFFTPSTPWLEVHAAPVHSAAKMPTVCKQFPFMVLGFI